MTRNKRNQDRSMGGKSQTQAMSLQEYMGESIGDLGSILSAHKYMNAVPISIFTITPDEQQPRRAIPKVVRDRWERTGDLKVDMTQLFDLWEQIINEERAPSSPPFVLLNYLGQQIDDADLNRTNENTNYDADIPPVELALIKVADVALSVRKYGLSNPITVASMVPEGYKIETGERRWLSFHLLHAKGLQTQQDQLTDDFSTISARKVDQVSVWRQAAENGARDDLNAIGKARQIAVLTMELHRERNQTEFLHYDAFEHERHFYAQIYSEEDQSFLRAVRGTQDLIIAAVGLKSGRQVSQYRKLLTLPDEAWDLADDHSLSEYSLRQVVDDKTSNDRAKIEMVRQIISGTFSDMTTPQPVAETTHDDPDIASSDVDGTVVPLSDNDQNNPGRRNRSEDPTPPTDGPGELAVPTPQFFESAARTFNRINTGNPTVNRNARLYLNKLREYLNQIEKRLDEIEKI